MTLLPIAILAAVVAAPPAPAEKPFSDLFEGLQFRAIGPYRGGRACAVAGVRGRPLIFYMGAAGGGVWKTRDAGATWDNVSDKHFKTGSVGSIAVAESDPNVLYVGMGEWTVRGNVSHGDGVYKSTDAGASWKKVGLEGTYQIANVLVHPKDADLVYVAAQGHIFGPNDDRGVFRSQDGGKSWKKVLFVDARTGASDLVMDPTSMEKIGKGEAAKQQAQAVAASLTAVEEKLLNPHIKSDEDDLNYEPKLDHELTYLAGLVASADARPTPSSVAYYEMLKDRLATVLAELSGIVDGPLAELNRTVRDSGVPPVVALPPGSGKTDR